VQIGDTVILVQDVEGVEAGCEGRVMSVRDDMVMVACRLRHRLQLVMAYAWEVLPEESFRLLCKREVRRRG
jgi:hypothetical protein